MSNNVSSEYIINDKGAKIYTEINRHAFLDVPDVTTAALDAGAKYTVLAVGFLKGRLPLITVKNDGGPEAYRLPDDLAGWVDMNMQAALKGIKMFPAEVEFGRLVEDNRTYAEIL